jgi:hypothetical protein
MAVRWLSFLRFQQLAQLCVSSTRLNKLGGSLAAGIHGGLAGAMLQEEAGNL